MPSLLGVTWQTVTDKASPRWSIQLLEVDMTNPNNCGRSRFYICWQRFRQFQPAHEYDGRARRCRGYYASNRMTNIYILIDGRFIGGSAGWWAETFIDSSESPALPPLRISQGLTQGMLRISWAGTANVSYRLQYSEDLELWENQGEPILGEGVDIVFEMNVANSRGFYRLITGN